jgi:signal transduction histidine kinase
MTKGPVAKPPAPTDETSRVGPRPISGVAPVGDAGPEEAPSGVLPGVGHAADRDARAASPSLEQRMIQADKLATFGQIAAGLVHELNNPLTSILAYTDYLLRKAEGGVPYEAQDLERLRRIGQSAERILRFTRELVTYARPSRGRVEPVGVHAAIDQAVAFCEHVLSSAHVQVVRHYGDEVESVDGASEQLVQVFVNLLTNASQAARPSGGSVAITTSRPPGPVERVIVVVEDDGSGIAPDDLPQIFVPFFTTRDDKQGTGLGLSIVKSIIDGHDGDIRVDSQVGRGTRFVIELPVTSVRRER